MRAIVNGITKIDEVSRAHSQAVKTHVIGGCSAADGVVERYVDGPVALTQVTLSQ